MRALCWDKARGPGSLGDPARGIHTLLDPVQAKNTTSRDPNPPSSRDPPFWPGLPSCTSMERAKGQGIPAREGVPARGFLELWAVCAWEYHEPGPPSGRDRNFRNTLVVGVEAKNLIFLLHPAAPRSVPILQEIKHVPNWKYHFASPSPPPVLTESPI